MFSSLGVSWFTVSDHYLAEPVLATIVLMVLFNSTARRSVVNALFTKQFVFGFLILVAFAVIGVARHGSLIAAYGDFRACFALLFCYTSVGLGQAQDDNAKRRVIYHLAFMILILGAVSPYISGEKAAVKVGANILACPLCLYMAARAGQAYALFLASLLSGYSFLRVSIEPIGSLSFSPVYVLGTLFLDSAAS